ncbi:MAG: hypothetical protein EA364_06530 [Balneolaceae bacterium]|nr:MAG: hypothetical protein EA364_06530 [Balneolaceae bacterium]
MAQKIFRRLVVAAVVGIIGYNIYEIGIAEVLGSLPSNPLFYIIFFLIFLTLPTAEIFIYRQVWPIKRRKIFRAALTKRVYNEEVLGYSGEFYLFTWARKHLDRDDIDILKNVRDNNILSAITSNFVAFSLIGTLVFTGVIDISNLTGHVDMVYLITGIVIFAALIALFVQFRRYFFALPLKKAALISFIYFSRFIVHNSLLIAQWAVVIPETKLSVWLIFVAVVIAVNRIPFLPSRDLVFMWAGIELAKALDMATASVAGMLLVYSALKKGTNLLLLLWFSYYPDGIQASPQPAGVQPETPPHSDPRHSDAQSDTPPQSDP